MAKLGKYNLLKILKRVDFGVYLDGGRDGEILMPVRYVPADSQPGDRLEVFVYLDSEDRLIATTETPLAQVDEFAYLRAVSVGGPGAFLDWGLMKDLLVPFREQKLRMREGQSYVVYIYEDTDTRRIVGSAKVEQFIDKDEPELEIQEEVQLLVYQQTELGYKAIVNNRYLGILYKNEVFRPLAIGQRLTGYVKQVRDDFKIDLMLQKPGMEQIEDVADGILEKLNQAGGFLAITDKSSTETIYDAFGISKKTYKKAIGHLYKKRLITLEPNGIRCTLPVKN